MNRAEFEDFIKRQQVNANKPPAPFDPARQLREWHEHLSKLYGIVEQFMKPYTESASASVSYEDIQLNEEFSGPYTARQLSLTIGKSTIAFKPIGTMLIGSKGRVDVRGPRGTARLGLVNGKLDNARQMIRVTVHLSGKPAQAPPIKSDEPIEWIWKIITPAPRMQFVELSEDKFFDMISAVADA